MLPKVYNLIKYWHKPDDTRAPKSGSWFHFKYEQSRGNHGDNRGKSVQGRLSHGLQFLHQFSSIFGRTMCQRTPLVRTHECSDYTAHAKLHHSTAISPACSLVMRSRTACFPKSRRILTLPWLALGLGRTLALVARAQSLQGQVPASLKTRLRGDPKSSRSSHALQPDPAYNVFIDSCCYVFS